MTLRAYLIPINEVTNPRGQSLRVPKYFPIGGGAQSPIAGLEGLDIAGEDDFGLQPTMLVVADVTPAQHGVLAGQPDVVSVPADISQNISAAALPTVQNELEALNIPGNWVTTSNTYQQVLHFVMACFQFAGRFVALTGLDIYAGNVTLNTQFNQLPAAARNGLQATATDMGLSTAGITGTSTVRDILQSVANQLPPYSLGGLSI
jgi:hypothetical protein